MPAFTSLSKRIAAVHAATERFMHEDDPIMHEAAYVRAVKLRHPGGPYRNEAERKRSARRRLTAVRYLENSRSPE